MKKLFVIILKIILKKFIFKSWFSKGWVFSIVPQANTRVTISGRLTV